MVSHARARERRKQASGKTDVALFRAPWQVQGHQRAQARCWEVPAGFLGRPVPSMEEECASLPGPEDK